MSKPRTHRLSAHERKLVLSTLDELNGNLSKTARRHGLNRKTVSLARDKRDREPPVFAEPVEPTADDAAPRLRLFVPGESGPIMRYVITSAQNNTAVNRLVWENLLALTGHYKAKLLIGRYIYNLDAQGQRGQEKDTPEGKKRSVKDDRWWAPEILPYVLDERLSLAPDLEWCGHINIMPTAVRPLSDLHNYTGQRSAIFPHPTIALESVPTGKHESTKINYTTGTVTERNYIQRKAGQKAEFHHTFGALLVEVDTESGDWWVRQLNADSHGVIHDLTLRARYGQVTSGHAVEAINWGDIHVQHLEDWMTSACWGKGGMIDVLRPRYQFLHDTLDFTSRSHHDMKNSHEMFRKWVSSSESVEQELIGVKEFLNLSSRQFCQSIVVDSNHDNALTKWLANATHKTDPINAVLYLEAELALHRAMVAKDDSFHVLEWALRHVGLKGDFRFLRTDESFVVCDDEGNGIECGQHGHLGTNGSRGADTQFVKMGRRMNLGHGHYALIWQGLFRAGVQGSLDHGYNVGASNWTQSMIVTYPNGKRSIVTYKNKKWRALDVCSRST